ncbi:alpha/beta fold hydrolase [Nakamurella leprariae]|uniref:Alpha/beta hydrolase n=1 Tax=Nakamurella leprariae TaxID=2803911 RepID=A0A939C2Q2_9ACTN|nr:alpha/beta hydrolase [Nakamurella leprariae]MBM9468342.1 alpha/beta hydrolase [Nakamurella leprariae]
MSTVDVPNVGTFTVNVVTTGSGDPLVFLHGYERHPGEAAFLTELGKSYSVVAPEQPGYGTSEGFENLTDIYDLVLFYRKFIETLGGPVVLVGHSSGGMIAGEIAAFFPHLVKKLVLVDSFGVWIDDQPAPQDPFGAPKDVQAALWADPSAKPDPEPTIFVEDPNDPFGAMFFQAQNLGTATKFLWPIADRGLARRLPYVDAPTLVVNGAKDGVVPVAQAEEIARLVPTAELEIIDGAGHYPMFEQPEQFLTVVKNFLAK